MPDKPATETAQISEQEANLLKLIRMTKFGQIVIQCEKGQPVMAKEVKKNIKL